MKNITILTILLTIIFSACKQGYDPLAFDENSQQQKDNKIILDYLAKENLTNFKNTESGIYYLIENEGEGEHPKTSSRIKAHYTGTFLNGEKFDSSVDRGQPLSFELGGVIKGWGESIPMLKKGGKGKFLIPSNLAYGSMDRGRIPANSILVFDIELIDFQ